MRRSFVALASFAVLGVLLACSDLKRADEEPAAPDGGGPDPSGDAGGGNDDAGGPSPGDAGPDVGQPPVDFQCDEPWIKATKTKVECAPRQAKVIDDDGAPDMQDISIARTPAGRVGIAFHAPFFIDEGALRFFYFTPATATFTPKKIERPGSTGFQAGFHVKLGASGPDTIHILAHDVDQDTSGDLVHTRLVNGQEPLTDPEVVVSTLQQRSEIALAVDPSGNVFATARVTAGTKDGGATLAKLVARRKQVGGAFAVMPDLADDLSPDDAPGTGSASLLFDPSGKPNVLFHYCESTTGSQPRYFIFDGSLWSSKKTVDNGSFDGFSGFSPRLAVHANKKIAAFFYRKGLQGGGATADLRVASWSLSGDTPSIEVVDQAIPADDVTNPRYRVAMAVDVYGLIHLAVVRPDSPVHGRLDYVRQTRVDGGTTKWLSDTIDPDVLGADQDAHVDLVIDEKARPHIAYRSGVDFKIRYVTRYDR